MHHICSLPLLFILFLTAEQRRHVFLSFKGTVRVIQPISTGSSILLLALKGQKGNMTLLNRLEY
jgi:hypothetical protein